MKKSLLVATFSLLAISGIKAQTSTYHPMLVDSNTWAVYGDIIPLMQPNHSGPSPQMVNMSGYITWIKDTVIDSLNYKKFYSRENEWNGVWSLLREDTAMRQVFIWTAGDTAERIIYDFSLNTGDSIWLDFSYQAPNQLQSGWWYIDSTNTYLIDAGPRNALYLSNPNNPLYMGQPRFIQWIESVGCNLSPLYLDEKTEEMFSGIDFYMPAGCDQNSHTYSTTCAWHDSLRIFNSECWEAVRQQSPSLWYINGDSCVFNLMGGIHDPVTGIESITLMPNPATSSTTMQFENATALEFEITITNILGQEIMKVAPFSWYAKGMHNVEIYLEGMKPGIYSVNMVGAYGVKAVKLIVE